MNKLLPKRTSAKTSFSVICDLLERRGPLPTIEIASRTGWEIKYTIETLAKVRKKEFIFFKDNKWHICHNGSLLAKKDGEYLRKEREKMPFI